MKKEVVLPSSLVAPATWAGLRAELAIVEPFPGPVLGEAEAAAAAPVQELNVEDLTHLPFLTIDPAESMDLDQAMYLTEVGDDFLVRYAIADVAAFVAAGSALDHEAHRRGETYYAPDTRVPLYPPILGEGAASLLPGQLCPAVVWSLRLNAAGELTSSSVNRALIRSRRRLDYEGAQALADTDSQIVLLKTIGRLREEQARLRGAVDLPTPEQIVEINSAGTPVLAYRAPLDCEQWNAQISLLTGMAAASMMVSGGIGLLRTLPSPEADSVKQLRLSAVALGLEWPETTSYGEFVTGLDPANGAAAALLTLATRLLRGAGYLAFDGDLDANYHHSAVAAPYAHCTAPLRRLADRYVNEVCLALCAGVEVPGWVKSALPLLPDEMKRADGRAAALQRASIDLAEALTMKDRIGEIFDAVVVATNDHGGMVQLRSPAVRAHCAGALQLGAEIRVRCVKADLANRTVDFTVAPDE